MDKGSSRFFVVVMVVFEEHEEADRCDQRIQLLKKELGYGEDFEFHFRENSHNVRTRFLEAVAPYGFVYFGFALNKDPAKLWGPGFQIKESLYKFTTGIVFENAKPYLKHAHITMDKSGSATFRSQLAKYLRRRMAAEDGTSLIKDVTMKVSRGNNLIQLADYVAGVTSRKVQEKANAAEYWRYIAAKQVDLRIWPE